MKDDIIPATHGGRIAVRVTLRAILCLGVVAGSLGAQRPLNLDFEERSVVDPKRPWGWWSSDFYSPSPLIQMTLDDSLRHSGQRSVRVQRGSGAPAWTAYHYLSVGELSGRSYRLSGWVRTAGLVGGSATLRAETFGPKYATTALDTMAGRGLSGTTGWTRLSVEGKLDSTALGVGLGVQLSGTGTAWFDALVLEVDGRRITQSSGPPAVTNAQAAWLRPRVVPLKTVEPGADHADLAPLRRLIGNARVVSLGEGTHGTREFFQLKHRIIEDLVRRAGFSVLMLEANQLQAERLNRYVLYGEGTAREALQAVFRILRTQEVLAVVEWARAFNASGQGRVEIVGYDMQDPRYAIDSVLAFLRRHDTAYVAAADSAYRKMRTAWGSSGYPARPDSIVRAWEGETAKVLDHVKRRHSAYLSVSRSRADSSAVEWAVQNATIAHQSAGFGDNSPNAVRDSAMAVNIAWTLNRRPPGTRAIVWAHNGHVARAPGTMGHYVEQLMPGQTLVVGFTTSGGSYSAAKGGSEPGLFSYPIIPASPPPSSIAHVLSGTGHQLSMVDMREARNDPQGAWMLEERPFLSFGGFGTDYGYFAEPVGRYYDLLVHVRQSTASRSIQ